MAACHMSSPCHNCNSQLNNIIWREVKKTQTPASKETIGLEKTEWSDSDSGVKWEITFMGHNSPWYLRRITHLIDSDHSRCLCREVSHQQERQQSTAISLPPICSYQLPSRQVAPGAEIHWIYRGAGETDNSYHEWATRNDIPYMIAYKPSRV